MAAGDDDPADGDVVLAVAYAPGAAGPTLVTVPSVSTRQRPDVHAVPKSVPSGRSATS